MDSDIGYDELEQAFAAVKGWHILWPRRTKDDGGPRMIQTPIGYFDDDTFEDWPLDVLAAALVDKVTRESQYLIFTTERTGPFRVHCWVKRFNGGSCGECDAEDYDDVAHGVGTTEATARIRAFNEWENERGSDDG